MILKKVKEFIKKPKSLPLVPKDTKDRFKNTPWRIKEMKAEEDRQHWRKLPPPPPPPPMAMPQVAHWY